MILDAVLLLALIISVMIGRKTGLFLMVARLCTLVLASLCTAFLKNPIISFIETMPFYEDLIKKITAFMDNALKTGETALIAPFIKDANMVIENAARGVLDTLLAACIFILILILVRIIIRALDKSLFKLPLVGSVNRFLGMAASFVFTIIIAYLVIGFLGGVALCSDFVFLREQMESSILVRNMYENNIILNLF